jgi:hypothetical protein
VLKAYKGYNLQILEQAEEDVKEMKAYLATLTVEHEFTVVEREGEICTNISFRSAD